MKESLHPTILFHFTKTKKALFNILAETFKISYAKESIQGIGNKREVGVPMVSFCDLKLHDLKQHIKNYGTYGIGLTKDWANKNGLNPVLYTNSECELIGNLMNALNGIYAHLKTVNTQPEYNALTDNYNNVLNLYRYTKNYEGPLRRKGKLVDTKYRFADEREWRYVPSISNPDILPFLPIDKIDTPSKKKRWNQRISQHRLQFQPDDIRYLIVKDDADINDLQVHLRKVKSRFDEPTIQRLSSRILTTYQINRDI
jgi:hypothetical protein